MVQLESQMSETTMAYKTNVTKLLTIQTIVRLISMILHCCASQKPILFSRHVEVRTKAVSCFISRLDCAVHKYLKSTRCKKISFMYSVSCAGFSHYERIMLEKRLSWTQINQDKINVIQ